MHFRRNLRVNECELGHCRATQGDDTGPDLIERAGLRSHLVPMSDQNRVDSAETGRDAQGIWRRAERLLLRPGPPGSGRVKVFGSVGSYARACDEL